MQGAYLFLLFIYITGFYIIYFTILQPLISRIYYLNDYLVSIDHCITDTVQLFNLEIYQAILCIVASRSAGKAWCDAMIRIYHVQNNMSHLCNSICYVNCPNCYGQTCICSVNCRTCFLNYRICRVKNGIYNEWNNICFRLNRTYYVCHVTCFVNYRSYAVKNQFIDFDPDPICGSGILMFESLKKLTKNILILHTLNLQNTIYRLKPEIKDHHLLAKQTYYDNVRGFLAKFGKVFIKLTN